MSREIFGRLAALPEYAAAQTVLLYLDIRSEVRTRWFLPAVWTAGKRVAVPYCEESRLGLFRLDHLDELAPGAMGILEPKPELRAAPTSESLRPTSI